MTLDVCHLTLDVDALCATCVGEGAARASYRCPTCGDVHTAELCASCTAVATLGTTCPPAAGLTAELRALVAGAVAEACA